MILQLNHLQRDPAASAARDVIDTLYSLLEDGSLEQDQFARLQIHLDWIQYRQNFRECVMVTKCISERQEYAPPLEVHIDTRQVIPETLRGEFLRTMTGVYTEAVQNPDHVVLEDFRSFRESIA